MARRSGESRPSAAFKLARASTAAVGSGDLEGTVEVVDGAVDDVVDMVVV